MKIAFVWPRGFDTDYVMPLSFGYLKSNIDNKKHEVKIIDCALHDIPIDSPRLKRILEDFNPDVVGVSCWSPTYHEAIQILEIAKSINRRSEQLTITKAAAARFKEFRKELKKEGFALRIKVVHNRGLKIKNLFSFTKDPVTENETSLEAHGLKIIMNDEDLERLKGVIIDSDGKKIQVRNGCKDVVTVMGGAHASSYPDPIMENPAVDFIFRGEAEL